jgi:three-Cys-motif partner protein
MSKKVFRSDDRGAAQLFGGPWSLIKTDIVEQYLRFFNQALKNQGFRRIYVDAFAGSGAFTYVRPVATGNLFGDTGNPSHSGSAQRALSLQPPFDELVFIESEAGNVRALEALRKKAGHSSVRIERGDANVVLQSVCSSEDWKRMRGVVFLDPFGMNVDWDTLRKLAETRAVDVWYLFALAGTVRNLPRLAAKLDHTKRAAVTRVLGTGAWFEEFYKPAQSNPLFGSSHPPTYKRTATVNEIEAYVKKRLLTLFPFVEQPRRLRGRGNTSLFSLFFAVSNPSSKAIELAKKGAAHILRNV